MNSRYILMLFVAFGLLSCKQPKNQSNLSFLHTQGQNIVNEKGEKIYLKGVGLGNWLLPEGYMWKFGANGDRPRKIEKVVEDLIGKEKAINFWKEYRKNYITEADIKRIAELGFNSVRPALNSRVFMTEEENPVFLDESFQLLDSLISWCGKYNLYVIIDLHGAPGGQTGANIDDSPKDLPEMFINKKFEDQTVDLWKKIAERYKDEPVVAAYDLLNEPLPGVTGSAEKYKHLLIPVYQRLITEIRKIDTKHMFTLEGFDWANNWSLFNKALDNNIFYQFHYYCWNKPDNLNNIDYFIEKRDTLNTPVWVGETGEKGNAIYWATAQYFKKNNIGFSFWPWKKMDTKNTPYSIKKPENWDLIAESTKSGQKPDTAVAEKAFTQFLENIKLENCTFFEDVANAILCRIPGKIEAENYGQQGLSKSYFVNDTAKKSAYYRTNEPVQIIVVDSTKNQNFSEQFIVLNSNEWVTYDFDNLVAKKYQIEMRASSEKPANIIVNINKKVTEIQLNNSDWKVINLGEFSLPEGHNQIQLKVKSNTVKLDFIDCK